MFCRLRGNQAKPMPAEKIRVGPTRATPGELTSGRVERKTTRPSRSAGKTGKLG